MPADRAQRVADIVESALEQETRDCASFVANACAGDTSLRAEVESLLNLRGEAREFIEQPAFETHAELFAGELQPGQRFGDYEIVSLIGEGGMGEVYLANDVSLARKVALKFVKGGVGGRNLLRHFRQEERILAGLTHPNIARLYGAGMLDDGTPYFAMEYVDGERLDSYSEMRRLSIAERLQLFRKICSAVSYAHQHLIIHRDLKPANIRVTAEGEPKLLDFGIAKLLDEEADSTPQATVTLAGVMTPEYASPEQVRGEAMTTASDVYSLGVVLYELLTGQKPYRLTSHRPEEISRAITGQQPAKPSSVATSSGGRPELSSPKALRGDLDNIVLMAMRKEPERRYISAALFAEDIRRHLEGRPVIARKDTVGYRASKFIARNRVGVAAAMLVLLALVGGIIATSWQARVARLERAKAEQRFSDVRKLANSYLFEFHDAIEHLPGSTPARALLVRRALEYLDSLAGEATGDATLQQEVVMAYLKVGNVQGNPANNNLGDSAGALESYRKALAIAEKWSPAVSDPALRRSVAMLHQKMGDVLAATDRVAEGVQSARTAVAIYRELADTSPTDLTAQLNFAIAQLKLGDILGNPNFVNLGDQQGAMENYRASAALLERLHADGARDQRTRRHLGMIHERIGSVLDSQKDAPGALAAYERSAEIRIPMAAEFPTETPIVRDGAIAYEKLADATVAIGNLDRALELRRKSLGMFEALLRADPQNVLAQQSVAVSLIHLGDLLGGPDSPNLGRAAEAIACYEKAEELLRRAKALDAANARTNRDLAEVQAKLAKLRATASE